MSETAPDQSAKFADAIEYYRRFALPFACVGFAALALPLGMRASSNVQVRSLVLSLIVILTYYLFLTLGESVAERGYAPASIAVWLPNLTIGAIAGHLTHRALRDHS